MKIKHDIQKFWNQNRQHIMPAVTFTKRCLENIIDMREKPNAIDYVNLAFSFKENLDNAYNLKDPYCYFDNSHWKLVTSNSIGLIICNLIQSAMKSRIVPVVAVDSVAAFVGEVEGVKFGWILYEDEAEKLYVEKSAEDKYTKILEKIFWETYPSNHVVLGIQDESNPSSKIYVKDDKKSVNFAPTPLAKSYADEINEYLNYGVSRSILFAGPPGSGKSNLVKNICFQLGLKTIRINNISQLSADAISEIIEIFNPDAIVLEDIDSMPTHDLSQLLDKLENLNKDLKLLFATANKLSKFNNATIRPERFDQIKKIFTLEKVIAMDLVFGDEEIYEKVKDWPAVFIKELMIRVKVKGKEYAFSNMDDLIERIQKINRTNYNLNSTDDDEEAFEQCEEDPPISKNILLRSLKAEAK